jgi:hypothetical protein
VDPAVAYDQGAEAAHVESPTGAGKAPAVAALVAVHHPFAHDALAIRARRPRDRNISIVL